jgi:phosphopantothenoylcysteine decarboxylase/phosphopantothenate--cysteine ligase
MTRCARRFVGPATFRGLTGRPVLTSMWRGDDPGAMNHLRPTETADLCVVAPATANIIGKLAGGVADDLVSTLLLAADCPVLLAPAMNQRMWLHPAVQRNIATLRDWGLQIAGPDAGPLACGDTGPGRMVAPEFLVETVTELLRRRPPRRAQQP